MVRQPMRQFDFYLDSKLLSEHQQTLSSLCFYLNVPEKRGRWSVKDLVQWLKEEHGIDYPAEFDVVAPNGRRIQAISR